MRINKIQTGLPLRSATQIEITIQEFKTDAELVMIKYELKDDNNYKVIDGYYQLTTSQYQNWGADNKIVEDYVLKYLGLHREGYVESFDVPHQVLFNQFSGSTSGNTINVFTYNEFD